MKRKYCATIMIALLCAVFPSVAAANTILSTWTWSDSVASGLVTGSAQFSVAPDGAGFDLVIVLKNTSPVLPVTTAQILTGLFFDVNPLSGPLTMAAASATGGLLSSTGQTSADGGSLDTNICAPGHGGTASDPSCPVTLGGGWEAGYDAQGLGNGQFVPHWGIATAGYGIFSGNGTTGAGNGNYGLAPTGGVATADGLPGMVPYVDGTATFRLTGLTTDQIVISHVIAAYGTAPEGTPGANDGGGGGGGQAPEPGSWVMIAGGGLTILLARRRSKVK